MTKFFRRSGWQNALLLLSVAILIFAGNGCKTREKTAAPVVKAEEKSAEDLQQLVSDSSFKTRTLSAKASVKAITGEEENSFNINLRIYTDSIIWISISPLLGIEVARVMIKKDTVWFMDRLNKRYSVSGLSSLTNKLQINVDFDIIQGILTGNFFAYKKDRFNSVYVEDKYYILSTLSKRKLKRSLEEVDIEKPIVQDLWIDAGTYRITRLNVQDQKLNKSLLTDYSDFRITEGGRFPFKSKTVINTEKILHFDIDYQKLTLNTDIEFPFNIPQGYEKIQ